MRAPPPHVKICGLTRRVDAEEAASAGAGFGGVILAPGYRRSIGPEDASALFEGLPLRRVGVFVDAGIDAVRAAAEAVGLDVVQLHGDEDPGYVAAVADAGPWAVWKALRPRTGADLEEGVRRYGGVAGGLLLDGWSPTARGGAGVTFPWDQASLHRGEIPDGVDLIVAGGLRPENVAEAVRLLSPTAVDVSSGVETEPGRKAAPLIRAFIAAARGQSDS